MIVVMLSCAACNYVEVKRGTVEKVEYLNGGFGTSNKTILYFDDGSTFFMPRTIDIPCKTVVITHEKWNNLYKVRCLYEAKEAKCQSKKP